MRIKVLPEKALREIIARARERTVSEWRGRTAPLVEDFPQLNVKAFLESIRCATVLSKIETKEKLVASNKKSLIEAGVPTKERRRILRALRDYNAGVYPRDYGHHLFHAELLTTKAAPPQV